MRSENREIRREPFHYRNKNYFVGLFIAIPLVLVPVFCGVILIRSDMFATWLDVVVRYESTEGLRKGNAVNMRGIQVGHVSSVSLDKSGSVVVGLRVRRRYAPHVRTSTVALLRQKNFVVGDWEIDLVTGDDSAPGAADGDTLWGDCPLKIDATLRQVTSMVSSLDALVGMVGDSAGALGRVMGLDSVGSVAPKLLARAVTVMEDVDRLLISADKMVGKMAAFGDNGVAATDSILMFAAHAELMLGAMETAVDRMERLIGAMDPLPADAGKLIGEMRQAVTEADTLLGAMKSHWFLRKSMERVRGN